jgi:SAM-dependent methyltransferase
VAAALARLALDGTDPSAPTGAPRRLSASVDRVTDPGDADTNRLAAESLAVGDPTAWFERLYAEADAGSATVPWDRPNPTPLLVDWLAGQFGDGRSAIVVGCGYGRDAEFVAALAFDTTAFDVSATAVEQARERHPDSPVRYERADLLYLPSRWTRAFDLVVESNNVQSLPPDLHPSAAAAVASLVAPGGTLLVLAARGEQALSGPPWPLSRDELDAFAVDGLVEHTIEAFEIDGRDRWRAVFGRAA